MWSAFKQTALHFWEYLALNTSMHFKVEISGNQMEKYNEVRYYKREY